MQSLEYYSNQPFINALKAFFKELNIPINYIADEPATPGVILGDKWNHNIEAHSLIDEVYALGMVNDAIFEGRETYQDLEEIRKFDKDYDGLLIFGVTLKERRDNLPITRSQLAEITRAFNRAFPYTPVIIVFKYDNLLSFANSERIPYKQSYREGDKVGKVSLLRDIDLQCTHRGHKDILNDLKIQSSGKNAVNSFASLYKYWQEVFSVSILNKRFYKELQNWYFWAIKEVTFPNSPNRFDYESDEKFDEAVKEHKGKNVIRLLTRILFIWFIKEKGLIPEQLFDEKVIAEKLIKDFTPQKPQGVFATGKNNSPYYRAILQNLFFATLNQEMGKRSFRSDGQHQNVTNLMRYKSYFKDPDYFVQLMEEVVPFMNGGLFECLDKPHPTLKGKQGGDVIIYNDGFSDRDDNPLVIPDYLFFDVDEVVDLSDDLGNKVFKNSNARGLIEILESYKFTITENTPIEEDVALDPELLGKVFENLLASYNPETKTTARKQTGSFYTPREIVNYMVDESLIAYLKTNVKEWNLEEEELDKQLHQLISYDTFNPFEGQENVTKEIIHALDKCKILDPACGSGAFPMGALQKMVHVLQKLDPENRIWKEIQLKKVQEETNEVFLNIENKAEREDKLKEINNAFDQKINDPDYARKLYLIENCIYGVDIQPIAIQISKLRFFISLVVDQKNNHNPNENFGIRPLPNLETKFVAANTLIDIEKPKAQLNLFENLEVKKLEADLKKVRHKLFSSKSPANKRKLREEDKELRNRISVLLANDGWDYNTARQLASWDPYDQNSSSSFFNPEWMFDIADGFDLVIGNPPYINTKSGIQSEFKNYYKSNYLSATGQFDLFSLFIELSTRYGKTVTLIVPKPLINNENYEIVRKILLKNRLQSLVIGSNIFENAGVESCIFICNPKAANTNIYYFDFENGFNHLFEINQDKFKKLPFNILNTLIYPHEYSLIENIQSNSNELGNFISILRGVESGKNDLSINSDKRGYSLIRGGDLNQYEIHESDLSIDVDFRNSTKYKTIELYSSPKLCIRRVGNKVISAIDVKNKVTLNTIYNCHLKSNEDEGYWGLSATLNSTLINFWFYKVFILDDTLFPYQRVSQIEKIPIKNIITNPLLCILSKANHFKKDYLIIDVTNSIVFNLYFPDHMQEREIDVLQFVERDVEKVMQGREFDSLSTEEKENVIEKLHQIWSNSDNEVIKRINLFKEKSPDILKPILES